MNLNQAIRRIQQIAEAHKQIRGFRKGLVQDLFADKTAKYAACCLQYVTGSISTGSHATSVSFRLFVLDLLNVSEDTKTNMDDVLSDTLSIMEDLIAQLNYPGFDDWIISSDNTLQALIEEENDMCAGWYMDFNVRFRYTQNKCAVPSDFEDYEPTDNNRKVYDLAYIATGLEGQVLTIPTLSGKYILHVIREGEPLHKVSNNPESAEYTTNGIDIGLGVNTSAGERFLILYREP